ncbi:MAG: C45 family peptidase [Deltaproteobacteria bacterium]|jgi:isopenicillin-N N-acyltransferase-like protein|nr:C45 family peptidase [Deltaproteobacteria bacterium]
MRVLELAGVGQSLGQAHGEALREEIKELVELVLANHAENIKIKVTRADLLDLASRNLVAISRYSPSLMAELEGIATGANLSLEEILFLNSFLELEDLRPPVLGAQLTTKPLWGCTTFHIRPEVTKEGRAFLAQTYDMESFYERFNVVLKIQRPTGQEIVYSLAGVLGLNGINDRGLGLVINKLVAKDARPGVIYPVIVREALSQDRLGDALAAILFADRASGLNYQLAAREGYGFCLELSASQYALLPIEGALAHTNHYLSPAMKPFEAPNWLTHGGSYVRLEVANRFLRDKRGQIDLPAIKAITQDHFNYPRSVCAHNALDEDENTACATIAGVILDLEEGALHLASGPPCQNEYQKFAFSPLAYPRKNSENPRD